MSRCIIAPVSAFSGAFTLSNWTTFEEKDRLHCLLTSSSVRLCSLGSESVQHVEAGADRRTAASTGGHSSRCSAKLDDDDDDDAE